MKIRATVSFGGTLSMGQGEVREYGDKTVLSDLLRAGYVEEVVEEPGTETEELQETGSIEESEEIIAPAQKRGRKKAVKACEDK